MRRLTITMDFHEGTDLALIQRNIERAGVRIKLFLSSEDKHDNHTADCPHCQSLKTFGDFNGLVDGGWSIKAVK